MTRQTPLAPRAAALVLLLGLALVACGDDESDIAAFLERGDAYMEEEQWKEAIIEYRNVLQIDPNHAAAHYSLAKSYLKIEKLREAYWELHETARLEPGNVEARLTFGQLNMAARDFEEALAQSEGVIELEPENGVAHVLRGQALEGLSRPEEAEAAYLEAREVNPEETAHLLILASYYQRQKKDDQAEPLLLEYAKVEPGFVSHTALGRFLARDRERDDEAEQAFRSALEGAEGAQQVNAHRNLAGFYFAKARFGEAEKVLEEGIEKSEEKLDLIYLLARFYRSQGEVAKADELIEQATLAQPDDPRPFLVLSAYRGRQGDPQGALDAAEKALAIEPGNAQAQLRKAELLVDAGYRTDEPLKIAEGRSIVDAVLAKEPTNPSGLFVRAKIQMAEGSADDAIESLRGAIDAKPDWAQAHFVLGSALSMTGDPTGARAELARAVELDPALLDARRLLAQVHAALGEHEYAIEHGRMYLRERPQHINTRILVAQSLVRIGRGPEALGELDGVPAEDRNAEVHYALGRLHAAKGELEASRSELLKANELRPNHPDILQTLLGLERKIGHFEQSVKRIREAVEVEPKNARLVMLRGLASMMSGSPEAAERDFKNATELDPNDLRAYEQLAYFYRLTNQVDKTITTYEQAAAAKPDNARIQHFLGVLYELNSDPQKAMEHYQRAIELDRQLGEAMNNLAYLLADRGEDLDRALDLAQEAKALLPESPNAADTLGWVLFKRGIPSAAVGYLREAEAGMDPSADSLGVIRHHLAQAYEANGEKDKAIESLARAIETLENQQEAAQGAGRTLADPSWAPEVRAMLERLQPTGTG